MNARSLSHWVGSIVLSARHLDANKMRARHPLATVEIESEIFIIIDVIAIHSFEREFYNSTV